MHKNILLAMMRFFLAVFAGLAAGQVTAAMANTVGEACKPWEAELYEMRVCESYACKTCSQEWCRDLCHDLKLKFGACMKTVQCKE